MRIKGVEDAAVNNAHNAMHIAYDPNLVTFSRIEGEARRIGAQIQAQIAHATFLLEGLDCPDCARSIERAVGALPGVLWVGANFSAAQVHVEYQRGHVSLDDIMRRIQGHGVSVEILTRDGEAMQSAVVSQIVPAAEGKRAKTAPLAFLRTRTGQTAVGAALAALALLAHLLEGWGDRDPVSRWLWAASILLGGWSTWRAALASLRARAVDMNVLMTLAVLGAVALRDWGEAASVVLLYGVGLSLQNSALDRTRRSIRALMSLTPPTACVRRGSKEEAVPVAQVRLGDTLIVRPGERIPIDGEVTNGASAVNEAPITGESVPVEKSQGAPVYAGTLNGQGALEIRVTRPYRDTVLSRILHSVEEAQAQRAPAEQMIDRFARAYTPIVFWLAVGVAFVPPLMLAGDFWWHFPEWFHRALTLLIVACPCALVVSTPVAIVTALGTASRRGILIKGGAYLEAIGAVKAVVYDKTGTLTQGVLRVEDVVPFGSLTCAEILSLAAAMESRSKHPLALAICQAASNQRATTPYEVTDFTELSGRGVRATVNGTPYLLGSPRLFQMQKVPLTPAAEKALAEAEAAGITAVLLGNAGGLEAILLLRDQPRPEAQSAIATLHRMGIVYQAMLTGDNARVAAQIAKAANLEEYEGGLLPEQKLQRIRHLQRRYGRVAMVGDGINDAPALAASDVGIAMGAAGSDVALEAADIALMQDDLSRLPFLVNLSRSTRNIVRQNVAFSLLTKAALLVGAVLVTLPLWVAVLGDVGVALLVTFNALRLVDGPDVNALPAYVAEPEADTEEALLELVFINDKSVDEQPEAGYVYPTWERFAVPFTGKPLRFGRRAASSVLPIQIEDAGMSRLHGEIRMEGGRPVVVDLRSTNGIRFNGRTAGALVPPLRPTPLRFGDNLFIGRNTRVEIRRPGDFAGGVQRMEETAEAEAENEAVEAPQEAAADSSATQDLRGKSGVPTSS